MCKSIAAGDEIPLVLEGGEGGEGGEGSEGGGGGAVLPYRSTLKTLCGESGSRRVDIFEVSARLMPEICRSDVGKDKTPSLEPPEREDHVALGRSALVGDSSDWFGTRWHGCVFNRVDSTGWP